MSNVYAPLYDEANNVIDPTFFVQSMGLLAGELNAGIDRDNLPEGTIVTADVAAQRVFNDISDGSFNTDSTHVPDRYTTSWQGTGPSGEGYSEFTTLQDEHFDIYWSGCFSWDDTAPYSWNGGSGTGANREDIFDTVRFRVTVDGVQVILLGPFEDGNLDHAAYGCGSIQLLAGPHVVRVEVELCRRIAQSGQVVGIVTQDLTIRSRNILTLARLR